VAVAVFFAVFLVVLLVVAHEIFEAEAVVARNEVDAGIRPAPAVLVKVAAAGDAGGKLRRRGVLALPKPAHRVAVAPVPFGPAHREVPDLVTAGADVPGFGDQLHLRDHRILMDDVEERAELVYVVKLTGQRRREIEAEPVHVHLFDPVA
jgi:hypothetical protein